MTATASGAELDARQLRRVFGRFATGVALVAAQVQGKAIGMLTNSFSSISLDPPLVALSFARTSTTWPQLREAPRWGISVLGEHHGREMADLRRPAIDRFAGLDWTADAEGALFLDRAIASISVSPHQEVVAGDHVVALLDVTAVHSVGDGDPLISFDSRTRRLDG